MTVAGITIERRAEGKCIGQATALVARRQIVLGPKIHRMLLLHELGHFLGEVPEESIAAQYARALGFLGGGPGLEIIRSEAAAWRWAVKAWTRRGRVLGEAEKRIIRGYFGSYLRHRWVSFARREADGIIVQTRRVPVGRNPRSHSSAR